jgi:hypothetical protein
MNLVMTVLSGLARQLLPQVHDTQKLLERESQLLQQELTTLTSELSGWSGKTQVCCSHTIGVVSTQPLRASNVLQDRTAGQADMSKTGGMQSWASQPHDGGCGALMLLLHSMQYKQGAQNVLPARGGPHGSTLCKSCCVLKPLPQPFLLWCKVTVWVWVCSVLL